MSFSFCSGLSCSCGGRTCFLCVGRVSTPCSTVKQWLIPENYTLLVLVRTELTVFRITFLCGRHSSSALCFSYNLCIVFCVSYNFSVLYDGRSLWQKVKWTSQCVHFATCIKGNKKKISGFVDFELGLYFLILLNAIHDNSSVVATEEHA